jgi:regulator of nucleoside diphosphate kinase
MLKETIIVPDADFRRIGTLIEETQRRLRLDNHLFALESLLEQALIVSTDDVPCDVATMNSTVRIRDLHGGEFESYTISYPDDVDVLSNRISVLNPLGAALLGRRVGDEVASPAPGGQIRWRIEQVRQNHSPMASSWMTARP